MNCQVTVNVMVAARGLKRHCRTQQIGPHAEAKSDEEVEETRSYGSHGCAEANSDEEEETRSYLDHGELNLGEEMTVLNGIKRGEIATWVITKVRNYNFLEGDSY